MTDTKDTKEPQKKTMKQLVEEKAKKDPHYLSLKNKPTAHQAKSKPYLR
jgi:hypothetical protein